MPAPGIKYFVTATVLLAWLLGSTPQGASAGTSSLLPHDLTHPVVMQQAAELVASAPVAPAAPAAQPLAGMHAAATVPVSGPLHREVFGFALASSLTDPAIGYPSWDFSLLSTVAFFGLHVSDTGGFAADSGATEWNSSGLTGLVGTAHAHGTKVVLTIILQDFTSGTPHMCAGLAHAATTVAATVAEVKAKGVDGVNVDYEGLNGSCGKTDPSWARHAMTSFAGSLRAGLPAGSYLSVDTYASSAIDPLGFFDVRGMAPAVDSFFVMAYDLEYSNYEHSPPGCRSFCLGPTSPLTGYYYNDTNTAAQYVSAAGPGKVILGLPYYGRKSCVTSPTANQYPATSVVADSYLDASQEYTATSLVKPGTYTGHRDANDPAGLERWDTWVNVSLNCTRELYWDDVTSMAKKYDLVNADNLRGVGLWTLNYGGGAPELWANINTHFSCATVATATSPAATTQFSVSLASGSCQSTAFDVQVYDTTLNQGWYVEPSVKAVSSASAALVDGFAGHTYQVRARARSVSGLVGTWTVVTVQVSATATQSRQWKGLYTLDGYGGIHSDDSPPLTQSAYWAGWRIARAAHALVSPTVGASGAVLDGFGGLHSYGTPLTLRWSAYWQGWDIARDFAFLPDGSGGYVLDGYGGLHPFSVNGAAMPPAAQTSVYWRGWDIARKVVIFPNGKGGYVMDAWGGLHSFGIGQAAPANPTFTGYWPGWDIARGLVLIPGTESGYVLDGYGALHAFAPAGQPMPAAPRISAYWRGWDIARSVWLEPSATSAAPSGYVIDGFGGLHPIGSAPAIQQSTYWQGWDIAVGLAGS